MQNGAKLPAKKNGNVNDATKDRIVELVDSSILLSKVLQLGSAAILEIEIDTKGADEISRRSRGTPRIANRLLRRVRDYAEVEAEGSVTEPVARAAMDLLEVDPHGFDSMDRKLLMTVIEKFEGGPVGIESLAAAVGEERGTLEDVVEPYLIQEGFLQRTSRGRIATNNAYRHFGLQMPSSREIPDSPRLFD